jgi:trk system potassium uptake protein TrkH
VSARAPAAILGRVDVGAGLNLVGILLRYLSLAFLVPAAVALGNGEPVWPFLAAGAITGGAGWIVEKTTTGGDRIGQREAFFVVAVSWLVAAFFVSLPYVLSGEEQFANPLDAYFEAMSGMTTTGATILTDVDALPKGLAMWRQLSQWLGGMGIIVLALAVLPRLRVGGRQLFESELPGPEVERLTASIRTVARRLWLLYAGLTLLEVVVLAVIGWTGLDPRMTLYDAFAHSFTTLPTGGFSTHARSIEYFGAASQWAIVAFMALAGMNFALIFRALRRHAGVWRDEELRLYVALLLVASGLVLAKLLSRDVFAGEAAVRHSVFQVVSMMTTTGYASTDFNLWPIFATLVLVLLMLVGGSAGSTAGAIKVVRVLLLAKILRRELDQTVHREAVVPVRLNGAVLDERTVRGVGSFILLYGVIFVVGALGLALTEAVVQTHVDLTWEETISAVATTLGNVGPGLGFLGPMGSFEPFSPVSKVILIVLMWAGRLELIPVVVLVTRGYWRR